MLGLYIHWPFCVSKCPYCDFNSHVADSVDHGAWCQALLTELAFWVEDTKGQKLRSIFFGGGTPSLMAPDTVAALIDEARKRWECDENLEITLEANPGTIDRDKFQAFRDAGVNRLSLGVQSLQDAELKFLGRKHDAKDAIRAIEMARQIFPRISFDLIYARPGQTVEQWSQELKEALKLAGEHLSLYQLTIEKGTNFHTRFSRGDFTIPEEDDALALYEITENTMSGHGMPAYEVSNYAKPGFECQHNLIYWRYQDFIGIGPGAHGRINVGCQKHGTIAQKAPETWLSQVQRDGHGLKSNVAITKEEEREERIMMGLRLVDGIPQHYYLDVDKSRLQIMMDEGFATQNGSNISLTLKGRLCLNAVTGYLLT